MGPATPSPPAWECSWEFKYLFEYSDFEYSGRLLGGSWLWPISSVQMLSHSSKTFCSGAFRKANARVCGELRWKATSGSELASWKLTVAYWSVLTGKRCSMSALPFRFAENSQRTPWFFSFFGLAERDFGDSTISLQIGTVGVCELSIVYSEELDQA